MVQNSRDGEDMIVKNSIEIPDVQPIGRFDPTPIPFTWHVRKTTDDKGVDSCKRRKIYSSILGSGWVGEWETVQI